MVEETSVSPVDSKISLLTSSDVRCEGILPTASAQQSTTSLQSVRCFDAEGRKLSEVPTASEFNDCIEFRDPEIKDLMSLETCKVQEENIKHNNFSDVNKVVGMLSKNVRLGTCGPTILGPRHIHLPLRRDAGKFAFMLENVLSQEECELLINEAEAIGFEPAGLGKSGKQVVVSDIRNSSRLITEDPVLAAHLFARLRPFLPVIQQGRRIIGLNEQLKILRYEPGQKFVTHIDGSFCRPGTSNRTYLTVQIYLSEACRVEGGATRFVAASGPGGTRCRPEQGRALVFQHSILHEGEEVKKGTKYTIRTDVEYGPMSWRSTLQELFWFGGSPREQRRVLLLGASAVITTCAVACAYVMKLRVHTMKW